MSGINQNRDALLAAMYDSGPEDEDVAEAVPGQPAAPAPERPGGIMNMPAMSAAIRRMQTTIEEQDRLIKRQAQRIRNLERQSNRHTQEINRLDTEMDTKVDRRQS